MQPILTTKRLVLTPLAASDRTTLGNVFSGQGVRRYLFDDEDVPADMLDAIMADNLRQGADGLGVWMIARGDEVIGCVGLHHALPQTIKTYPAFAGETEVIVALTEQHWSKGCAREAVDAALAYAFDTLGLRRRVALVDEPNERSHALMQACGFRRIGAAQEPLYMTIAYERPV